MHRSDTLEGGKERGRKKKIPGSVPHSGATERVGVCVVLCVCVCVSRWVSCSCYVALMNGLTFWRGGGWSMGFGGGGAQRSDHRAERQAASSLGSEQMSPRCTSEGEEGTAGPHRWKEGG